MPGMMETVLNLGLNDRTVEGLAARTRNERFAWDCYRRFITMYGNVVLHLKRDIFEEPLSAVKRRLGVANDPDVPAEELRKLAETYKDLVAERTGAPFPQDPREQLRLAINAVFESWFAKKAIEYRRINGIPADWGTAVTVMAMVFGNLGETSGTGVGFTRDPRTGEPALLRRVPGQRPGRRCGGGHPNARAHRRAPAPHASRSTTSCSASPTA